MSFFKRCRFFKNFVVLGLLGFHEFRWQWAGPTAGARFGNCLRRRSGFSLVSLLGGCRPRALQIQNLIFVLFRCGCATVRVDVFQAEFERGFSSGVGFQVGTPLPRRSLQRTLTSHACCKKCGYMFFCSLNSSTSSGLPPCPSEASASWGAVCRGPPRRDPC